MKFIKLLICCLIVSLSGVMTNAQPPKREMRSVWVAGMGIDWPKSHNITTQKKELCTILDNLKSQGIYNICLHVRPRADAYYKSTLEPWSADLTGTRGKDPGYDPLAYAIEECHKRGMEIYAWLNPYRVNANGVKYTTDFDNQWRENGWLIYSGKWTSFNPGLEGARRHCLDVMKEIYDNYMIDGMLFDDYFYPGDQMSKDSSADDWELYLELGKPQGLSIGDWRRQNVNTFIKELYDDIQKTRPDMRFGIGPAGVSRVSASKYGLDEPACSASDWQYDGIYADCLSWMHDGTIDFLAPQLYWQTTHSSNPFGPLTEYYAKAAEKFNRHSYISIGSYKLDNYGGNTEAGWGEFGKEVQICRDKARINDAGQIYYNCTSISGTQLGKYLGENAYTRQSLTPVVYWKERVNYGAPTNAALSGTDLKWDATKGEGKAIIRYTVYAIPTSVSIEMAQNGDGDGLSNEYLLDMSYSTTYTLPADRRNGYWYAVCVLDGYGYESEPALIGYNAEPGTPAVPVSPEDGADAGLTPTLTWTSAPNSTNTAQVAYDKEFTKLFKEYAAGSDNQVTIDLTAVTVSDRVYWRVVSTQPDKLAAYSDVRSLVVPEHEIDNEPDYVQQQDRATYAKQGTVEIENLWIRSTGAPYENMSFADNGVHQRGMTANDRRVYLSKRSGALSAAEIYLAEYSAETGKFLRDIRLSDDGQGPFYPCNDVLCDTKGNICISNLSLNISSTPIKIFAADLNDGSLTPVAELTHSAGGRVDHIGIYGDVAAGNFTVFAAIAGTPTLVRWTVTDGRSDAGQTRAISDFHPTSSVNFGTAPKCVPASADLVYVDGSTTGWSLYNFGTGKLVAHPGQNATLQTASTEDNGGAIFTVNGREMMVYSVEPSRTGARFNIAAGNNSDFSKSALQWTVPESSLGTVISTTCSAPCAAVSHSDGSATVYIYSPGNGLAAYRITDTEAGVDDITVSAPGRLNVRMSGLTAGLDREAKSIHAYTPDGRLAASAANTATLTLPGAGTYIIVADNATALVAAH